MIKNSPKLLLIFLFVAQFLVAQTAPIANDDTIILIVNTTLTQSAPGVLDNDTDSDGDALTVTSFLINGTSYNAGLTANFTEGNITILEDGKWWINSVKKRISKAESARENGRKGGRPKKGKTPKKDEEIKTQKPIEKTQAQNPKNPPLESKRERESKIEKESKTKVNSENVVFEISGFEKSLRKYFSQTTDVLQMRLSSFLRSLKNKGELDEFEKQTIAYVKYKKLSEEKVHSWQGYQAEWKNTDWVDKLSKLKIKPKDFKKEQQTDVDRKYLTIPKI